MILWLDIRLMRVFIVYDKLVQLLIANDGPCAPTILPQAWGHVYPDHLTQTRTKGKLISRKGYQFCKNYL